MIRPFLLPRESDPPASVLEAPASGRPGRVQLRSEGRRRGSERVAELYDAAMRRRAAAGDEAVSGPRIADALGVSTSKARDLRTGAARLGLGDLYCHPRSIALELLDEVRAEIAGREPPLRLAPERHVLRLVTAVHELAAAVEDGAKVAVLQVRARALTERVAQFDQDLAAREAA